MIYIGKPYLETKDEEYFIKAHIRDEVRNIDKDLWFMTTSEWKDYLCYEVADAFVVAQLLPAVQTHQDIVVDAPLSEKLYYGIINFVLEALKIAWCPKDEIPNIRCTNLITPDYKPFANATGCSLGVDSFTAIKQMSSENCPSNFRLTHFTFFNVGSFGCLAYDENIKKSYLTDLKRIKEFANKIDFPVITLESNIYDFYGFSFDNSHTLRNISGTLALQKLIKNYYYASGEPLSQFGFNKDDLARYEQVILPYLSTSCTSVYPANTNMSRIDKIKYIMNDKIVQENLNVCLQYQLVTIYKHTDFEINTDFANCTRCEKCCRTILALDFLGVLDKFDKIFDVEYYKKHRLGFLEQLYLKHKTNVFYEEIYSLMLGKGEKIPLKIKIKNLPFIKFIYKFIKKYK